MKNSFYTYIFSFFAISILPVISSCNLDPECKEAVVDLSLEALNTTVNVAVLGQEFRVQCLIKNVVSTIDVCTGSTTTEEAEGTFEVAYSPTFSDRFSDYVVYQSGPFEIKKLAANGFQEDYIPIIPDVAGYYAVKVVLNTGAYPISEGNIDNNSQAISIRAD
ncbi:MAG: hypothetical protein IPN76_34400 [Saprospiraceae bacterium]|nr:hypothetical protein [Saprospiraceae bacterium]